MKKSISLFLVAFLFCACSKSDEQQTPPAQVNNIAAPTISVDENTVYSFDINTLSTGCDSASDMICAINTSIKCTINPKFEECETNKDFMPNFVFMEDESLQRPTAQSYKITKLKPLADGSIEVYTQSTCNGNWFGLCNGNIIFVMKNKNNHWTVLDLYAIEN